MIDFHSHILPGIDDGSKSLEESLAMLRMEREQGITHIVATPHFYPRYDKPEEFLQRRDRAEEQLRRLIEMESEMPQLTVGAEVYYFRGISDSDFLPKLTFRGKSCIMIEMPHAPWPETVFEELRQIYDRWGIVPIIAHIDRYIKPLRTFRIPDKLESLPVLIQANGDFFLNISTSRMALRMLKENRIHLLGSDCHNTSSRRPNLGEAVEVIEKRLSTTVIDRIQRYGSEALQL